MGIIRKGKKTTFDPKIVELAYKMALSDDRSFPKFIEHLVKKEAKIGRAHV
jgi:hypothetical protein